MWYLLAAAGACYLAQRWQNAHRARPVMAGCGQNPRTSPPTSSPPTPNRRSSSLSKAFSCDLGMPRKLLHDVNAGVLNTSADEECPLIGLEAPLSHFVTGSKEGNSEHLKANMSQIAASQDKCPSYQVKTNKRSAHQAFLVPVMDALEPIQGNPEEHAVSIACSNRDFIRIDSELKDEGGFISPSLSLCCSSSSTVHNSPIGRQLTVQEFGSAQFQEGKQKQKVVPHQQEDVFWSCEAGVIVDSSQNPSKFDALKESVQGIGFSQCPVQPEYSEQRSLLCDGNLQHTSPSSCQEGMLDSLITEPNSDTNVLAIETTSNGPLVTKDNLMWDANTVKHDLFSSKRSDGGNTSTDSYKREVMNINNSKSEMLHPTLEIAADINCTRKAVPLLSSDHSVTTENFCDSESESLVGFGVGIAVLFMVSSSKREIEKMGKVLKETEDLVSDMRKDLDERKARSHMPLVNVGVVGNDNLPTVKIKYAAAQEQATPNTDCHIDSFCEDSLSDDDESIRSVLTEEHVQGDWHMSDLEAELEAELEIMKSNMEGNDSSQKQVNHANSGECSAGYDSEDDNASSTLEVDEINYMVSTIELERKLWEVFQQRQEERIMELEGTLELALNKLHAKEKELLWWKDRACSLMEHSSRATSGKTS